MISWTRLFSILHHFQSSLFENFRFSRTFCFILMRNKRLSRNKTFTSRAFGFILCLGIVCGFWQLNQGWIWGEQFFSYSSIRNVYSFISIVLFIWILNDFLWTRISSSSHCWKSKLICYFSRKIELSLVSLSFCRFLSLLFDTFIDSWGLMSC